VVEAWSLAAHFGQSKIRHVFEIYFWVGNSKSKDKGENSVAPPFGLRSGLRQSGRASRRDFIVGLKPHA
jgi:hypothetical protein